jgi:transcription antitermination factor NusG
MLQESNVGLQKCDSESGAVSNTPRPWQPTPTMPAPVTAVEEPRWYAIHTRARYEEKITTQLQDKGIATFLPLIARKHRWSDRYQTIQFALFPCHVSVHLQAYPMKRLAMLQTPGVVGFVGIRGVGLPIPNKGIDDIRTLLTQKVTCALYSFLRVGQRVRMRGGCLDWVEGILVAKNSNRSLVVSIELMQRSVAVRIEGYDVEPV